MLDKIVHIRSIGRFRNYAACGDVSLRKLTLIYAENGRGKTTLCGILRSLQTGQTEFIAERKTLNDTAPSEVHLRLGGADFRFTNDAWTAVHADILIFDPVFVSENVYSGDYVEHEQKKNLYRVIVGAEGVRLAKQIEELDRQIRDINADLRTKEGALSKHLPPGVALTDYLRWQPVADIAEQVRRKSEELSIWQHTTARSGEIQARHPFAKVILPFLPSDFFAVLAKQLSDIVSDAETKVRQHIAQQQMGLQGESWLSQGLGYVKDDRCPFCGQGVRANDLIKAYRSHFSDAYGSLKQDVAQLAIQVDTAIGERAQSPILQALADNAALVEFWRPFTTVDLPVIPLPDIQRQYATIRNRCLALARRKQDTPTEAVTPDTEFTAAVSQFEVLRTVVASYNAAVDAANLLTQKHKAAASSQGDQAALRNELAQMEARKERFDPEVAGACRAYQTALDSKVTLERSKTATRTLLDRICRDLLKAHEQSINAYLDQFGAGFKITNARHLYTGGAPSSHYQIEINNTPLDLGDVRTTAGTPCFKTSLSSGDRSALALAFFLAMLKQDAGIGRKIVVFDDPFTSLDRFRRTCTQQFIHRLSDSAEQVIVLSHEPLFLKLLFDECPSAEAGVKTLQMSKAGGTTVIGEWDIGVETSPPVGRVPVRRGPERPLGRGVGRGIWGGGSLRRVVPIRRTAMKACGDLGVSAGPFRRGRDRRGWREVPFRPSRGRDGAGKCP
ncbi:MAG: AAA family ATPase [Planctomycetes bacterium]|nr:AAA family ATPase [Planctomycetota bacterium]